MSIFLSTVLFLILFNTNQTTLGKVDIGDLKAKPDQTCEIQGDNQCDAFVTASVIEVDDIVTSDETLADQFIASTGQLDTKYGIETAVELTDPFGNTIKKSDILNIPYYSVTANNQIIDLSDIKISFYFITKEKLVSFKGEGDVQFYLDDQPIEGGSKKIFASRDTLQNRTIALSVADVSFAPFSQRKDAFGFTFKDEIPKWDDQSEHSFKVILKSFKGTASKEGEIPKTLEWSGEHIAYELKMKYDDTKLAIKSDNTIKLKIKNDSTISTCGMGGQAIFATLLQGGSSSSPFQYISQPSPSPDIEIWKNNALVETIKGSVGTQNGYVQYDSSGHYQSIVAPSNGCSKFESLERDSDYTFKVEGRSYDYITKSSQENLFIQCSKSETAIGDSNPSAHSYYIQGFKYEKCESNFGYSKTTKLN